jgi:3-hydroxypropanoate dehydrogenase
VTDTLGDPALDQLFRLARTYNAWLDEPMPAGLPQELYDLIKWGPTSANCSPGRFVFVATPEGKEKLSPHLSNGNRAKTLSAPLCVIIAYDVDFTERMLELFPHQPSAKHWFGDAAAREITALRNSSLQGAYLMMAARALGLDCGPMSGFDNAGVDAAFFAGTTVKSNFICTIGHGTQDNLFERLPRLAFDEVCRIA